MDLSKLPKLAGRQSNDTSSVAPEQIPTAQAEGFSPGSSAHQSASPGWVLISLIIGVIFLFMGQSFARWLIATSASQPFSTGVIWSVGPKAGQPVGYWDLQGATAWTDCGMFLFGLSAIVDAMAMLVFLRSHRPAARAAAMTIGVLFTALATVFNLVVCIKLFSLGILPLFSLLAVGLGGYFLLEQYPILFAKKTGSPARHYTVKK